nr:MFS transporter [Cercospora sp. JNU001]
MASPARSTHTDTESHDVVKSDSESKLELEHSDSDIQDEKPASKSAETPEAKSEEDEELNDQGEKYISGWPLVFLLLAMVSTVFIVALSNTIISTAIPAITTAFNSTRDIGWYNSGEALAATAFQLPFGRAYLLMDLKWTFLVSLTLYLIGSLICGVANSSVLLILGRAIAGVGNAGVFAGVFIIIARNVPLRKRALYAGLVGATFAIAAVLGPVLGGIFTDRISWRWCFYINLPIGAVAVAIIVFLLPSRPGEKAAEVKDLSWWQFFLKLNPFGSALLLGSLACFFLALQWGGGEYPWSAGRVVAVLVVFAVSFIGWLVLQYFQGDEATLPYSVAKQRTVGGASVYTLLLSAAFGLVIYYLPLWFQAVRSDSAEAAGLKQLGIVISLTLSSIAAGGAVVKIGYYNPFIYAGTVLCSIGAGLLYTITLDTPQWDIIGYSIVFAIGIGVSLEQSNVAVQTVLPDAQIPAGTSLVLFVRLLGSAIPGPIGQSVLQTTLASRLGTKVAEQAYGGTGATEIRSKLDNIFGAGTPEARDALDAFNDSVTKIFMVAIIVSCLSALPLPFIEWRSVKTAKRESEDAKEGKKKDTATGQTEDPEKGQDAEVAGKAV